MRRAFLATAVSLGIHVVLVLAALGYAAWRGISLVRAVEVVPISLESVSELPLGPPPSASAAPASTEVVAAPPRPRPRPRPRVATHAPGPAGPDAGAPPPAPPPPAPGRGQGKDPKDLRSYGPEGSRLTALLRLDRLRASADGRGYIAPVDEILKLLPDRKRLLEGTGLDLYRDFDALLIATPNPFDDTVTFLAARHHLDDAGMRAALDRGAETAGRPITWSEQAGRPVGTRATHDRDDRLFVMPQPGLVVIAPPAYAALLLERPGDAGAPPDRGRARWADLIARIDAEDGAVPEHAVFMMTATNLLRSPSREQAPVPGAPGALPRVMSMVAGTTPTSFLELTGDFATESQATTWESEWPTWRQRFLANPLILLAGLTPIVTRAELTRDDRKVNLRTTATPEETRRILQMIGNFARTALQNRAARQAPPAPR
jgi:hypothetical protein